jgi:hypothetical protein
MTAFPPHLTLRIVDDSLSRSRRTSTAFVTLCVHAGIAASDAICCHALGEHAQGENHVDAVQHLKRVRPDGQEFAKALETLLRFKTRAGYAADPVNADMLKRSKRAAEVLVTAARDRLKG